jgi:hypothetical protein
MAFHKCFVISIVEMIGSVREIIPIQIGLSLSDEISYQEQMYLLMCSSLPSFFLLLQQVEVLLLASISDLNARANERHDPVLVQVDGHLPRGLSQSVALLEDSGSHQVSIQEQRVRRGYLRRRSSYECMHP